jgi:calmodulin
LSPTVGVTQGGRKISSVLIEETTRNIAMANQGEPASYLPPGYTKCDLKAGSRVPTFKVTNERAWANPTPTPWGRDKISLDLGRPAYDTVDMSSSVVGKFRSFYSTIEEVKAAFVQYDVNKDGNISMKELEDGMVQTGQFSFDEARQAFEIADINGDGEIDIAEFVQVMFPTAAEIVSNLRKCFNSMEDVETTFNSWDLNKDGSISYTELKQAVSKTSAKLSEEEMNAIFVIGDIDQNGEIDLEEFKRLMMPTSSDVVAKFRAIHKTVHDVQLAFKKFDADGDGSIDRQELTQALNNSGTKFTLQEINVIFNAADIDKDGAVDYEEFIGLMCPSASDIVSKFRSLYRSIEEVRAAFKRFDANGDGALSKDELAAAMKSSGQSYSSIEINAIFSLGDVDGDGEITISEFVTLMSPSASEVLQKLRKNYKNINDVKKAFKAIDTNNDGLLSKDEMKTSGGNQFDNEDVNAIFELGDVNGDGEIDLGEFIGLMFPSAAEVVYKLSANFKNINHVKDSFRTLDSDGDGSITRDEMATSSHKFNQEQIEAIFALGDVNDDGAIDIDEYIAVMCPSANVVISRIKQKFNNISEAKRAFLKIDIDRDGKLSRNEMANSQFNTQEIDAIFILGDINGDGELDLEEFIGLMCPAASVAVAKLSKTVKNINEAQMLFRIMDKNGDGLLSMEEMRDCGMKFNQWELDALFAIGDVNNDGEIDMNEFVSVICPCAETLVSRISKTLGSLSDIKTLFVKMDKNKDGQISKDEMRGSGLNDQEVDAIFKLGDSNNDGEIDIDEFITVMCPSASAVVFKVSQSFKSKECAMETFKKMDTNKDGQISKQEMGNAGLPDGSKLNPFEIEAIFALGDINKDGEIDMEEFLSVMMPQAGISQAFSSSSNTQYMKSSSSSFQQKSSSSSIQQKSSSSAVQQKSSASSVQQKSSSVQQKSSSSFASSQSYSSTTTYSSTTVSVSFSNAGEVKQAFRRFDTDGDGHLDKNELKNLLIQSGKSVSDQEVDLLFRQGDVDGDGRIDMQEFVKLMFPAANATLSKLQQSFNSLNDVKASFRKYDSDGDGHISRSELRQVMSSFSDPEVDSIFALGDKDQSGGIDYQEFIGLMIPNSSNILSKIAAQFASIQKIKDGFKKIDNNNDGAISRNELRSGLRLGDAELDVVFAIGDIDQDGEISMSEFIRLMSPSAASGMNRLRNSFRDISEVIRAFKKFDANNDGALSQQELLNGINGIGLQLSQQECTGIFGMADINQDGEINYVEFVSALFPAAADGLAKFRSRLGAITDVKVAFKRFDADGDGEISINELAKGAEISCGPKGEKLA